MDTDISPAELLQRLPTPEAIMDRIAKLRGEIAALRQLLRAANAREYELPLQRPPSAREVPRV